MNARYYRYTILCVMAFLLSGCIQIRVNKISEETLAFQFIKSLEKKDWIVFETKEGFQDFVWTSQIEFSDPIIISSAYGMFEKLGSYADCDIIIQHNSEKITGGVRLYTKPDDFSTPDKCIIYFNSRIGTLCYFLHSDIQYYLRKLEIKGECFENCLVADSANTERYLYDFPGYNDSISGYAFSSEVGLLYYTMKDGRKYVRKDL